MFATGKRGSYEYKYDGLDAIREYFQYEINGKLLTILNSEDGVPPNLRGDWVLIEMSKDQLILAKGLENEYNKSCTLELKKVY